MAQAHRCTAARLTARTELPFATLGLLALLSLPTLLAQGGDWPLALLAGAAVLAVPGAALEAVLGLARATLWLQGGDGS